MRIRNAIESKISAAFEPERLEILDTSANHAGHSGAHPEGESHFKVLIVAKAFEAQNRVARQRMVFDVLAQEMAEHIHALELQTMTPDEANR